jgi:hypothetical protein
MSHRFGKVIASFLRVTEMIKTDAEIIISAAI